MKSIKLTPVKITVCAVFAALSAVLSQVSVPIGAVPINLTHVSIFIAAGLLGKTYGTVSQIVFVLLGAVGAPVFSGFRGGLGVVFGPTGGFIFGYILCAFITAYIIEKFGYSWFVMIIAMYAGWFLTYVTGCVWFMVVMKTNDIFAVLSACVVPFLLGDIPKTVISVIAVKKLKPLTRYIAV